MFLYTQVLNPWYPWTATWLFFFEANAAAATVWMSSMTQWTDMPMRAIERARIRGSLKVLSNPRPYWGPTRRSIATLTLVK